MYDPTDGAEDLIKQMEEDSKAELKEIEEAESNPEVKEPEETKTPEEDDAVEEGDDENDAVSDDAKKRARAFARQRNEAKQAKEEAAAASKQLQEMRERLARLEGRSETTPQPKQENLAEQEPDKDLYPDDHRDWELRQVKKELEDIKNFRKESEQQSQYQREQAGVRALEQQFKATAPDYEDAANFIIQRERDTKKMLFPQMTDAQIDAQIEQEKVQLFKHLLSQGQNPTEVVYKIAKRDGFTGKKPEAKPQVNLDKVAENQRKSASLIGGSSGSDSTKMTSDQVMQKSIEDLMRMSDSDWRKVESTAR